MVAGRLRYADAQQARFATHDVVGRVAQRLVGLGDGFGEPAGDGRIEIALPLSQEELAAWTGSSREAVVGDRHVDAVAWFYPEPAAG